MHLVLFVVINPILKLTFHFWVFLTKMVYLLFSISFISLLEFNNFLDSLLKFRVHLPYLKFIFFSKSFDVALILWLNVSIILPMLKLDLLDLFLQFLNLTYCILTRGIKLGLKNWLILLWTCNLVIQLTFSILRITNELT